MRELLRFFVSEGCLGESESVVCKVGFVLRGPFPYAFEACETGDGIETFSVVGVGHAAKHFDDSVTFVIGFEELESSPGSYVAEFDDVEFLQARGTVGDDSGGGPESVANTSGNVGVDANGFDGDDTQLFREGAWGGILAVDSDARSAGVLKDVGFIFEDSPYIVDADHVGIELDTEVSDLIAGVNTLVKCAAGDCDEGTDTNQEAFDK